MDRFALDTGTAERLVAGSLDASDAPPEYRAVAQTLQALRQPADSAELAGRAETVDQIAAAIVVARRTRPEPRPKRSPVRAGKLAGAAASIVIALTSGFAVAGALPESAQNAASGVLGRVGIPTPTRDEQATPQIGSTFERVVQGSDSRSLFAVSGQEQPTGDEQPTGEEQATVGDSPTTAGPPPTTGAVEPERPPATNAADGSVASGPGPDEGSALCREVKRQGELRAADVTDAEAIAALVDALPTDRKVDAALFYYPYGGDIPDGTDTSDVAAQAAGDRLHELYREQCGYDGP
jgi:hypothetical protein